MPEDEFAGQGGCYELDVLTGKRVLIHRTLEAPVEVNPVIEPEPAPPPYTPPDSLENEPV